MKVIKLNDGTSIEYTEALHIKRDFDGAYRNGLEFTIPAGMIGMDTLLSLMNKTGNVGTIELHAIEEDGAEYLTVHDNYQIVQECTLRKVIDPDTHEEYNRIILVLLKKTELEIEQDTMRAELDALKAIVDNLAK